MAPSEPQAPKIDGRLISLGDGRAGGDGRDRSRGSSQLHNGKDRPSISICCSPGSFVPNQLVAPRPVTHCHGCIPFLSSTPHHSTHPAHLFPPTCIEQDPAINQEELVTGPSGLHHHLSTDAIVGPMSYVKTSTSRLEAARAHTAPQEEDTAAAQVLWLPPRRPSQAPQSRVEGAKSGRPRQPTHSTRSGR
jgi:hypothetical protein